MFRSFGNSWQLVKASWAVLRADKELILFPIISAIVMIIVSILFLTPIAVIIGLIGGGTGTSDMMGWIILFIFYLVSYTIGIYFNVGLIGAAMIRLDGGDPTLGDGFRIANSKLGKIVGYAAISATVGVILRMLEENWIIGQIVSGLFGMAWSLITFLAVPILVANDVSPIDAIKQSGSLLKRTWGEQITGNFSIFGVFFIIYILIVLAAIGLGFVAASLESGILIAVVIIAAIAAFLIVGVIQGALSGIFSVALYRYAETGVAPDNFDIDVIQGAFKPKRKR